ETYPFSALAETGANTLIFPNLAAGNIAYKLLMEIGGAEAIGPILLGMKKPVHILQLGSSIREIVNMAAIAVVDAQKREPGVANGSPKPCAAVNRQKGRLARQFLNCVRFS